MFSASSDRYTGLRLGISLEHDTITITTDTVLKINEVASTTVDRRNVIDCRTHIFHGVQFGDTDTNEHGAYDILLLLIIVHKNSVISAGMKQPMDGCHVRIGVYRKSVSFRVFPSHRCQLSSDGDVPRTKTLGIDRRTHCIYGTHGISDTANDVYWKWQTHRYESAPDFGRCVAPAPAPLLYVLSE